MTEKVNTGGTKEFIYTKEDMKRIRSEDTPSTKDFKEGYNEWLRTKPPKKQNIIGNNISKLRWGWWILIILIIILLYLFYKSGYNYEVMLSYIDFSKIK